MKWNDFLHWGFNHNLSISFKDGNTRQPHIILRLMAKNDRQFCMIVPLNAVNPYSFETTVDMVLSHLKEFNIESPSERSSVQVADGVKHVIAGSHLEYLQWCNEQGVVPMDHVYVNNPSMLHDLTKIPKESIVLYGSYAERPDFDQIQHFLLPVMRI